MLQKAHSNAPKSILKTELADAKTACDSLNLSQAHLDLPAEIELPIIEGDLVPIEIPNIGRILRKFTLLKTRRGYSFPSSAAIVLGVNPLKSLQWLFYRPGTGFFSLMTGKSSNSPEMFLQLTGGRYSSEPSSIQNIPPLLPNVLAHMPSAVSGNPEYNAPYNGSIILGITANSAALSLSLIWVDDKGGFWDIPDKATAEAPLHYSQLSPGDSRINPRTFPLHSNCRSRVTKKSDLTIIL